MENWADLICHNTSAAVTVYNTKVSMFGIINFIYLFIYGLFNDTVSTSDYTVLDDRWSVKSELEKDKKGSSCDLIRRSIPAFA
jgi:hypothetical protein